jgi:hypothetical protein
VKLVMLSIDVPSNTRDCKERGIGINDEVSVVRVSPLASP